MKILLILVAVVVLTGCGSQCTEDDLKEKIQEVTVKVQALATSGDMGKLMEFSKRANEISKTMQGGDDIQAACDAADELLNQL